ncbi:pyridoxamine 5'-phosphate oxidase family protein [Candidatus Parcubacteria bacterium]|nr:pyridoxamine 5'-phosphate oxidase family protein [Candidatus Parcubacteria bacterium]
MSISDPVEKGKREEALLFLKNHMAGVLATVSPEGDPHASLVFYAADDDFSVCFLTLTESRKYAALMTNPRVAFTVAEQDRPQTLQIEGVAEKLSALDMDKVADLIAVLTAGKDFYPPVTKIGKPGADIVRIRPTWIRWGDFTISGEVFSEIQPSLLR